MNIHDYCYNHEDEELSKQWTEYIKKRIVIDAEVETLRGDIKLWKAICAFLMCTIGFLLSLVVI